MRPLSGPLNAIILRFIGKPYVLRASLAMHCLVCGSEMRLDQVAGNESVPVSGFEHRTFRCPSCGDIEQRLAFSQPRDAGFAESSGEIESEAIQSSATVEQSAIAAATEEPVFKKPPGIYARLRRLLTFRREVAAPPRSPATAPATEPFSTVETVETAPSTVPTSPHSVESLVDLTEADKHLDECEALLKHAIEMVRGPACSSAPAIETDSECEALFGTIEMDREPAHSELPVALDFTPPDSFASNEGSESRPTKPVAEIHYDPLKARYAARDTTTGMLVMRHEDRALLKGMCERMGWQVAELVG